MLEATRYIRLAKKNKVTVFYESFLRGRDTEGLPALGVALTGGVHFQHIFRQKGVGGGISRTVLNRKHISQRAHLNVTELNRN